MKLLHFHLCRKRLLGEEESVELGKKTTILGQCTSLVAEKILDSAEFFRQSAGAYDRAWDLVVLHDQMSIDRLSHV
jgi:hypothetical protein